MLLRVFSSKLLIPCCSRPCCSMRGIISSSVPLVSHGHSLKPASRQLNERTFPPPSLPGRVAVGLLPPMSRAVRVLPGVLPSVGDDGLNPPPVVVGVPVGFFLFSMIRSSQVRCRSINLQNGCRISRSRVNV